MRQCDRGKWQACFHVYLVQKKTDLKHYICHIYSVTMYKKNPYMLYIGSIITKMLLQCHRQIDLIKLNSQTAMLSTTTTNLYKLINPKHRYTTELHTDYSTSLLFCHPFSAVILHTQCASQLCSKYAALDQIKLAALYHGLRKKNMKILS